MSTKVIFYCFRKDTKKSPVTNIYRPQRSWGKVMFLHMSAILFAGEGVVSQHALQQVSRGDGIPACLAGFQAHTQGEVEGSGQGVSRPTPKGEVEGSGLGGGGLQAHTLGGWCLQVLTWRGLQAHTQRGVYPSMH